MVCDKDMSATSEKTRNTPIRMKWVIFLCAISVSAFANINFAKKSYNYYPTDPIYTNVQSLRSIGDSDTVPDYAKGASKCLTFDGEMDDLIANSKQIFLTMPAKAAGSSLKTFTNKCMKSIMPGDNFHINDPEISKKYFTDSFQLPKIITGHVYRDQTLIDLIQHTSRGTLLIYVHRDETSRLRSAIQQVTSRYCANDFGQLDPASLNFSHNKTHCMFDEGPLLESVIQKKRLEIGWGAGRILTCKMYDAIEQNAPNMVFVHYKKADRLQNLLAKHHCPELLEAEHQNEAIHKKEKTAVIRLDKDKRAVQLSSYLEAKSETIEWALKLKRDITCQAKFRKIESDLLHCEDEIISVSV
mmetsp:Transcript_50818/g.99378  ORF Transcript_50818/g.99378 Transcript_50818/m.99378 type:complete len:357 (-) Transcript_50818:90-1160(-)